jgi:hypothetical protein
MFLRRAITILQRRALALFSGSAKPKKERKSAKKKSAKKSESAERERKKAQIRAFSSPYNRNPVSEPKSEDRQKRTGKVG